MADRKQGALHFAAATQKAYRHNGLDVLAGWTGYSGFICPADHLEKKVKMAAPFFRR
jgi:hypothetical protein